jgi:hypothetical protein
MMIKHKMAYTILGFIVGVSLSSGFANDIKTFILSEINYKIMVNDVEYNDDQLPPLNYMGSTYVPLKKIGDLLNGNVKWNSELNRVEIGEAVNVVNKITDENNDGIVAKTNVTNENDNMSNSTPVVKEKEIKYSKTHSISLSDYPEIVSQYVLLRSVYDQYTTNNKTFDGMIKNYGEYRMFQLFKVVRNPYSYTLIKEIPMDKLGVYGGGKTYILKKYVEDELVVLMND